MYLGKATVEEENVNNFVALSKIFLKKSSTKVQEERAISVDLDLRPKTLPSSVKDSIPADYQSKSAKLRWTK